MKNVLKISSVVSFAVGVVLMISGFWGIVFTYKNVAREKIVTPADAAIPQKPVRGPLTLKAQADIIREHTLKITEGKTFAEMPQQVPKVDQNNQPVLDADGNPVMVPNTARDIWITATTLITALNLGILAYAFSGLVILLGFVFIWIGIISFALSRRDSGL